MTEKWTKGPRKIRAAHDGNGHRIGWELFLDGIMVDFFYRRQDALTAIEQPLEGGESYWIETTKWRAPRTKARGEG